MDGWIALTIEQHITHTIVRCVVVISWISSLLFLMLLMLLMLLLLLLLILAEERSE